MTDRNDIISAPSHYIAGRQYEPIDVMLDWFPENPLLWQVCKYIARAGRKGPALQDLQKAKFYLQKAIEREELK